jgi:hypothetical protein
MIGRALIEQIEQLLQGNLRLGRKLDVFRHPGFEPAGRVVGLVAGQVQLRGHRQTALGVCAPAASVNLTSGVTSRNSCSCAIVRSFVSSMLITIFG